MATNTKRSRQIKITVTPELHAKLLTLAEAYGQPPATAASFILGQAVANQLNGLQAAVRVGEAFAARAADSFNEGLREVSK